MVTIKQMNNDNDIIDQLGGTVRVAELCKVRPQAVSKWRRDGIPQARLMFLAAIRPDVVRTNSTRFGAGAAAP